MVLNRFKPRRITKTEDNVNMQTYPVFAPTSGMKTSIPPMELEDRFVYWANNILFHENKIKQRFGLSKYGTTTPLAGGPVLNITEYIKYDGTTYLVAFTTKNAYLYNATTALWNVITEQDAISDCQDAWTASANVTSTADTDVYRVGTKSAKHAIADAFATGLASYINFASLDISGHTHVYFYIRSSVVLTAGQEQILLDDTNGCASPVETLDVPAVPVVDTWYEFCVELAAPASCSALLSVGLNIAVDIGAATIYLDQILAVSCYTGNEENKIETEQIYDNTSGEMMFVMTNGSDNIKTWGGTGAYADLSGSPNKARHFINFKHYLMLLNTTVSGEQAPQRIEWPQQGKPTLWTLLDSGNNSLAEKSGFLLGAIPFRAGLAVIKDDSISYCSFVGGLDPFEFEENRLPGKGCCASGSIQLLADKIIYLGWDNVYKYDGFDAVPVRDDVTSELFSRLNKEKLDVIHSQKIDDLNLYLLFIASAGETYPNLCWAYNYITEAWSFWEFDKKITSSGFGSTDTSVKIGEALNKIGTYSLKIGDRSILKNNTFCLLGTSDGYIHQLNPSSYSDDGVAIDGYIDTKSYVLSGIDVFSFLCQLVVFGKGYNLDVYISIDDGQNFVLVGELVQNRTTDSVSFLRKIDKTADKFMLRLRNNTNNEWFEVSGWELGYIRKKRVVKPILTYNITRITTSGIDRITSGGDNREISI